MEQQSLIGENNNTLDFVNVMNAIEVTADDLKKLLDTKPRRATSLKERKPNKVKKQVPQREVSIENASKLIEEAINKLGESSAVKLIIKQLFDKLEPEIGQIGHSTRNIFLQQKEEMENISSADKCINKLQTMANLLEILK